MCNRKRAEVERLNDYIDPTQDPYPDVHGVLLSDQIRNYVEHCRLLDPFSVSNLRAASYQHFDRLSPSQKDSHTDG